MKEADRDFSSSQINSLACPVPLKTPSIKHGVIDLFAGSLLVVVLWPLPLSLLLACRLLFGMVCHMLYVKISLWDVIICQGGASGPGLAEGAGLGPPLCAWVCWNQGLMAF